MKKSRVISLALRRTMPGYGTLLAVYTMEFIRDGRYDDMYRSISWIAYILPASYRTVASLDGRYAPTIWKGGVVGSGTARHERASET